MKKRKLLSLIMACIFILSCCVAIAVPTGAAEPTEKPTALPSGGKIDFYKEWVNWTTLGLEASVENISVTDGMLNLGAGNFLWCGKDLTDPVAWRGASGLMVYVDAATVANPNFLMAMLSSGSRPNANNEAKWTQITTIDPLYRGQVAAYYYKNSEWKTIRTSTTQGSNYLNIGESFEGWVYVPLDSFWYRGGSGNNRTDDEAYGKNFSEFMGNFEKATIARMAIQTSTPGIKFGNVHLVYQDIPDMDATYTTKPLFDIMTEAGHEGEAAGIIDENSIIVAGMTGNNGTEDTGSDSREILGGLAVTDLEGAAGLRFYVDTTALDDGARLQPRIRLKADSTVASKSNVYKNGVGYLEPNPAEWKDPQYVCRAYNSVAYYYDESNVAHALHTQSNVTTQKNGDLFEALPENYKGYVYIPFDSMWMSGTSYSNLNLAIPFEYASVNYTIDQLIICHAIEGTTAFDAITYSDFELLYVADENTKITGASITIDNNIDLNVYATVGDDTQPPQMKFDVGNSSVTLDGEKQADDSYKFVYENVLPQTMGDKITITLLAKIGSQDLKQTKNYSVLDYCKNKLADSATPAELKTLLVDMLYYGEAAQKYANYKTDALVTKNLSDGEKALKSADTTASIAGSAEKSGTASEQYKWASVSLKLEGVLSLKLKLQAASTVGLTADVTVNGRTVTYNQFSEASGTFVIVFNQLGVEEMDDEITLVLKVNGEATGETITCTAAAYIKEALNSADVDDSVKSLLRAAYAYGQSVSSYAAA